MNSYVLNSILASILLMASLLAANGCASDKQTITGTVVRTDTGFVIETGDGEIAYRVDDNIDMSALVGKKIQARGALMERKASRSITVTGFVVVSEDTSHRGDRTPGSKTE